MPMSREQESKKKLRVLVASNDDEQNIRDVEGKGPWRFPMPMDSQEGEIALIFTHKALIACGTITKKPPKKTKGSKFGNRPVRKGEIGNIKLLEEEKPLGEMPEGWLWPTHPRRSFCTPSDEHAALLMAMVDRALGKISRSVVPAPEIQPQDDEHESSSNGGSGYEEDPAVREAVELRAMELAEKHYRDNGFHVEDVSENCSYDLRCTGNGREIHVEVKGTRGDGAKVELTIGEVNNARDPKWRSDLFVVSEIKVTTRNGDIKGTGGKSRIALAWSPDDADLEAIRFRYSIPPGLLRDVAGKRQTTKNSAPKSKSARAPSTRPTTRKA
jgi:hypothetical protein